MKVLLVCTFVMAVVGAVRSAAPPRKAKFCCFPQQYEAFSGEIAGYALPHGKGMVSNILSHFAVDNKNERAANEMTQTVNGKTTKLKILVNYKEKVRYVINGETCIKSVMNATQLKCIPDNAQFGGTFYVVDKKLTLNVYNFPFKQMGDFEGNASVSVTQDKCIQVSSILVGQTMVPPAPSLPVLISSGVFNFTSGIKDPNHWFTIPSFCPREISEVSERSVDSNPVSGFLALSSVMMESTVEE